MPGGSSAEVIGLWNASLALRPDERALSTRPLLPEDTRYLRDEAGRLVGLASVWGPERPWAPGQGGPGSLRVLIVHPQARGRGIGSGLLEWATSTLRGRGATAVSLGGEADHYLPGVPAEMAESIAWFERRGFTLAPGISNDLARDLADLPPFEPPRGVRVGVAVPEAAKAFLEATFPGRWAYEVRRVLERSPEQVLALEVDGRTEGFATVGLRGDPVLIPSCLWPSEDCGLGPMGVSQGLRGRGLGKLLLVGAMHHNARRGGTRMGIDWTGVQAFYETAGFQVVRRYRHLSRRL
jgi:GNAT superfamily N-acetyltransferase